MTCIVAEVVDGVVHMAGDKAGINGDCKSMVVRPKVFINGDFIIGYTTSFRMGQLLEFTWNPPTQVPEQADEHFIYKTVVDSIKENSMKCKTIMLSSGLTSMGLLVVVNKRLKLCCTPSIRLAMSVLWKIVCR